MATSARAVPACLLAAVPVLQPPHLEGDASLATEILPGPPPMASVQQNGLPRKDHKKTAPAFSYLPVSDPGTTYGPLVNPLVTAVSTEGDGTRRKRARLDKGSSTTRAQRASARNLTALGATEAVGEGVASSSHLAQDSDAPTMPLDIDELTMSRSASLVQQDEPVVPSANKRPRRDKGKGREKEPVVKVKEEPVAVSLNVQEVAPALSNEDHCSSCRSMGALVYCDGCPRAFHLWCLNPPIEASDLPEGEMRWFCPACEVRQKPPGKVPAAKFKLMTPLLEQLQHSLPLEFQLPQDIRSFFKDVATGSKGAYVDSSEIKAPRLNRHGQLEDRDPYRLKDRNGDPVLCFKCGNSALPPGVAASAPATKRTRRATSLRNAAESGRGIISCDYCHLHWHLDCVEPPLSFVPPWEKRWMCPNHADHLHNPRRRIPRHNPPVDEVHSPGVQNNGNIEITQPEAPAAVPPATVSVDEVLINGKRYRVPERIITMDFWNKISNSHSRKYSTAMDSSPLSSPLTELSELDENDEIPPRVSQKGLFNVEELQTALFLCGLERHVKRPAQGSINTPIQIHSDSSPALSEESGVAPAVRKLDLEVHNNGVAKAEVNGRRSTRSTRSRTSSSRPLRSSAGSRSQHPSAKEPHHEQTEVPQTNDARILHNAQPAHPALRTHTSPHVSQPNGAIYVPKTLSLSSVTAVSQPLPSSVLSRPRRFRQPPRGRQSPALVSPLARSTNHSDNDTPGNDNFASDTTQSSSSQPLAGGDPKVFRPTPYWLPSTAKPTTPLPSASTGSPTSAPIVKTEPLSTSTLKIRLPSLTSFKDSLVTAPPSVPDNHSRTRTSGRARTKKAPTRRSHRHTSGSGSLNDPQPDILLPPV